MHTGLCLPSTLSGASVPPAACLTLLVFPQGRQLPACLPLSAFTTSVPPAKRLRPTLSVISMPRLQRAEGFARCAIQHLVWHADSTEVIIQFIDKRSADAAVRASDMRTIRIQNLIISVERYNASPVDTLRPGQLPAAHKPDTPEVLDEAQVVYDDPAMYSAVEHLSLQVRPPCLCVTCVLPCWDGKARRVSCMDDSILL